MDPLVYIIPIIIAVVAFIGFYLGAPILAERRRAKERSARGEGPSSLGSPRTGRRRHA